MDEEWAANFEQTATKEEFLGEALNKGVLKGHMKQSLSDNSSARKRKPQGVLFQLLGHQRLVWRFSMASDMSRRERRKEIA